MSKLEKIWNVVYTPTLFLLGALNMWIGNVEIGALYILVGTNETIKTK